MAADKKRVLIVDDSESLCAYLAAQLESCFSVVADRAENGHRALEKIARSGNAYELLFVDLHMPGMDGVELLRAVAEIGCRAHIVIISVLDARVINLAVDIARQHKLNVIGSIQKPFDEEKFEQIKARLSRPDYLRPIDLHLLSDVELKEAIVSRQLQPYFQVQIDSSTQRVVAIEALARICRPGLAAAITPDRFLATAEQHKLLKTMDLLLFDQSLRVFADLRRALPELDCHLSVNVSPSYLNDRMIPNTLAKKTEQAGLSPKQICLEITEQHLVASLVQLETLDRLRIAGFALALDDFGTGFTNIHQLIRYPFTTVKIDRSLVKHVATDPLTKVIVRALVDIAHTADLSIVAEGVELETDLAHLMEYEGLYLQGFLIAKPKPAEQLQRWLASWMKTRGTGQEAGSGKQAG